MAINKPDFLAGGVILNCAPKVGTINSNMKESKYPIKVAAVRMLDEGRSVSSICKELHIGPNQSGFMLEAGDIKKSSHHCELFFG